ncbi:GNAT family N-acetyltransferase [Olivibacter sp. SDN3]|uniref:GNAT family N-acetyltransferase n=1 Tax=Olivibacter sp. SDN3 TaxID=2764720 RepID=UPI001650FF34|nr:GNAT family N-acetyltransferase [Olivibacter sp. SDN3]QNL49306.1 GNAT family N-acetyltransferase [Olivibacter sp. SDN3]
MRKNKSTLYLSKIESDYPWDLFLLADPSMKAINEYLPGSACYLAFNGGGETVGGAIVRKAHHGYYELMNIAVYEKFQKQGWGIKLLTAIVQKVQQLGGKKLELGTGTFGYQLKFYQKVGFRVTGIEKDFFLKKYKEPIIEDGLQHSDMLRLSLDLEDS